MSIPTRPSTPICHRMIGHATSADWPSVSCYGSACAMWVRAEWPNIVIESGAERIASPGTGRCADNREGVPWNDPELASRMNRDAEPKEP